MAVTKFNVMSISLNSILQVVNLTPPSVDHLVQLERPRILLNAVDYLRNVQWQYLIIL